MTIKKLLIYSGILLGAAAFALVASLVAANENYQQIIRSQSTRLVSLSLAEELKESSRNLTFMAENFTITGDERFADEYMDILLVRSGEHPRPDGSVIAPGQCIALSDLLSQANYSYEELQLLERSRKRSDNLVSMEIEAINAIHGLFPGVNGDYTISGEPDRNRAVALIFSPGYYAEIAAIMEPLAEFHDKLELRLDSAVSSAQASYDRAIFLVWSILVIVLVMFAGFLVIVSLVIVRPVLLCDIFAKQVISGKFESRLSYTSGNEIGSLAESLHSMLQTLVGRMREEAERFSAVVSLSSIGIAIKDRDGVITDWNSGAQNILGYTPEEVIGHTSVMYAQPEQREEIRAVNEHILQSKALAHLETKSIHKDGRLVVCSTSLSPIINFNNEMTGSVDIFRDSTSEKSAEQAAKRLAAIIAAADAGIVVKDKNGIVEEWNIGAETILGYKPGEIIGKSTKFYAPEESHESIDDIECIMKNGEHISNVDVVRKHKDGRLVDCSASYTPIFDGTTFIGSVAIFHDITSKKIAEQTTKRLAAIVAVADAAIVLKNKDGTVEEWNIGAENILGFGPHEMLGKTEAEYTPEEKHADIGEIERRLKNGEHISHMDIVRRHRDGKRIDCSASYTPIFDGATFIGSVMIFHDISENKKMERALKEAVIASEAASKAKSSFLANMSHEIRTPMNGVIGFAELALDEEDVSDKIRDCLTKIKISADGLLTIINDILDLSKIEAGKIEIEQTPFSLHDVLRQCETISSIKAEEKGISLYFYSEPFVSKKLVGDPTRLRQILLNLLSNAVKFTNKGAVKLSCMLEEETAGSARILFEIKDSGIGMTPEQMKTVFEPFAQADNSTTRKYGGTGLGLPITKSMVELMGGTLFVESVRGIGSKFTFSLLFDTIESDEEPVVEIVRNEDIKKPMFSGNVLVCEDNVMNQMVINEHLSRVGLVATIVENGKLGVDKVSDYMAAGKHFDLIFMDIHMPVMDGLEASKKLSEIGNITPIVAITANAMEKDKEIYLTNGMSDYLAKPFIAQELWSCLLRYLKPLKLMQASEPQAEALVMPVSTINRSLGLERVAGNEELYEHLLSDFVKANSGVFDKLNNAVSRGDITSAHRIAHTLKGTAGLIGAERLQKAVESVEKSLADGKASFTPAQMSTLETELNIVLSALASSVHESIETGQPPGILDAEKVMEITVSLEPLLETGDTKCLTLLPEIKKAFTPLGKKSSVLVEQMEEYSFELAIETLRDIKAILPHS